MTPLSPKLTYVFFGLSLCVSTMAYSQDTSPWKSLFSTPAPQVTQTALPSFSVNDIGLLNQDNGGFPETIWEKSHLDTVLALIHTLPAHTQSPLADSLKRRLLLSSAKPPLSSKSSHPDDSLFKARLTHLALSSEAEAVNDLLKKLPEKFHQPYMDNMLISSYFLSDRYNEACQATQKIKDQPSELFWRLANTVCQSYQGHDNQADLSLNLMKEDRLAFPDSFPSVVKNVNSTDAAKVKKAKQDWLDYLNTMLSPKKKPTSLPTLSSTVLSPVHTTEFKRWWDKVQQYSKIQQLQTVVNVYSVLDALNNQTDSHLAYDFLFFALTNELETPSLLYITLLNKTLAEKKQGETILLITHMLAKKPANTLPKSVIVTTVRALKEIQLTQEARQLALEALISTSKL